MKFFKMQKRLPAVLIFSFMFINGFARQQMTDTVAVRPDSADTEYRVRNFAWFTPNGANEVNGLAIGLQAIPLRRQKMNISGVNLEAGIVTLFVFPYFIVDMVGKKKDRVMDYLEVDSQDVRVNGLSLSFGGLIGAEVNGITLSGGFAQLTRVRGITVTGISSRVNTMRGIQISGISNKTKYGTGLQIALFNKCENLKGLQLGLWNSNGKRKLPIINWSF